MNIPGFGPKKGSKNASKYKDDSTQDKGFDDDDDDEDDDDLGNHNHNNSEEIEMSDLRSRNVGKNADRTRDADD